MSANIMYELFGESARRFMDVSTILEGKSSENNVYKLLIEIALLDVLSSLVFCYKEMFGLLLKTQHTDVFI